MNPKVGVVVVAYKAEKFILPCLSALRRSTIPVFRVVVVVYNKSEEKTVAALRRSWPNLQIIKSRKNLGFAAGVNIGIRYLLKYGNINYFLLLNPDTKVSPKLVEELIKPFSNQNKIGVTGPIITYQGKKNIIWFAGGYFNKLFCFSRHPLMDKDVNTAHIKSGETDFITGGCLMIKREVIDKVPIDEKYFLYFEDVFFCEKIRKLGYACYLVAKPLVSHLVSATTGEVGSNRMTPLRAYYFARNPLLYIKGEVRGFLRIANIFGQLFIRLPYYSFQMLKIGDFHSFISYIKGLRDGFLQTIKLA